MTMKEFEKKYGVHFSTALDGKLLDVYAFTTSVKENPYCKNRVNCDGMICKECYANASLDYRKNCRDSYGANTAVITSVIIPIEDIPYIVSPSGYFRFESHGDLINEIQVVNYFNMARYNPHLKCALWTKNPWIIRKAFEKYDIEKPENLVIVGSSYFVNKAMEMSAYTFIDKIFTVYESAYATENGIEINCGLRQCAECGRCYENYGGRYVNELPKKEQRKMARAAK